jgi:tRNA threonylcarbamoyl adenosine modification protein YeaZ
MHVLAIDTALEACAAAVFDTGSATILASETIAMARGHAEALMPLIARVMDCARLEFADLDRIAVTVGPGSFTGLRTGIAAARGIALAAGRAAVGLSTLAAFAAPHVGTADTRAIVSVIDARNGHVYLQIFSSTGRTLVAPRIVSIGEAVQLALARPGRLVGSAAQLLAAAWPETAEPPTEVKAEAAPDIAWVARLGAAARAGESPPKPLYLRPPDARSQDAARLPRR